MWGNLQRIPRTRDGSYVGLMHRIVSDFRLALRGLRRAPTLAITAALVLGVATGMTSAIATVYDAVLRAPLPVREQERLVLPRALDARGVELALFVDELD